MTISELLLSYGQSARAVALLKELEQDSPSSLSLYGLSGSSSAFLFASIVARLNRTLVFILDDNDEAGYFYNDVKQMLGDEKVFFLPSGYKRAVKYGQRDNAAGILRTEVLAKLSQKDSVHKDNIIVTYPQAVAELVVSQTNLDNRLIRLKVGDTIDTSSLTKKLRDYGFTETDYVYEPGQFAMRGSILDVYSFSCEYPYRIDFFGDDVDTIRTFNVEDQLSMDKKTDVEIVPELKGVKSDKTSFLKFLPNDAILLMKDFTFVHDVIDKTYKEGFSSQAMAERLDDATEMEQKLIRQEMLKDNNLITASSFVSDAVNFKRVFLSNDNDALSKDKKGEDISVIRYATVPQPLFHKNFDLLCQTLEDFQLKQYKLFILADSPKQCERLKDIFASDELKKYGISFTSVEHTVHAGFIDDDNKICVFTDHQIFDRFHKYNLRSDAAHAGKMALSMKELQEMEPGDFIVHVDFGIGKFGGLVRVPSGNSYQEMIRIIYQNNDKVDVSIHSLYKISKYRSSATGEAPRLSTLGTGAWDRLKEKTKKRIKDIARDLIKLYASRRHESGFAFSADSYMQHELEAGFLYEDTPDQYKATVDVKGDMEKAKPMDRLICGDVGFGKTEVAIRAAFKAACDSKQVAVLVPTTVLAFQHYKNFRDRLKDFPVNVEYLSRARSAKQTKQLLDDLASGKIDIIIGTHKLIGKSVKWHDLGLLIIDEEQKFGVSTKEKLRKIKTNVDTLTMSATPIPRTLQFSLMGARDMSIIRTPPPNRYPIHTELTTYNHEVIADAINFEMSRNGQVYFVNDRISSLTEIENMIHKYVPDCRVAVGHGRMKPEELEKIIMGFMNYDYDVLLSTTIVENGIDISNANTIIINDAHRFGLSDLHQMRGRVGRSNRKAFCYLLAPPKSVLSPEARRRLEALETFSGLGSGFSLAMQDLDIRGAGNLLGSEQSGFMEDLGYETYQKILSQAVTELKNDEFGELYNDEMAEGRNITGDDFVDDCAIESDLEMYFPDSYVPGSSERMLLYRELDKIEDEKELKDYRDRLIDRFGPVPKEGEELMQVVRLRRLGKSLGCEKIILRGGIMQMQFVGNAKSAFYQSKSFGNVISYASSHISRALLHEKNSRRLMAVQNVSSVEMACKILDEMKCSV